MKFVGPVNSARDPLVLLKCAQYTEEKSTIAAKKIEENAKREHAKHESKSLHSICFD